jgi:hypothetical protein
MKAVEPILTALGAGGIPVLWAGRSPRDLDVDADGKIRPLIEGLRRQLRERLGAVLLAYSKATGLVWDTADLRDHGVRNVVESGLRAHELIDLGGPGGNLAPFMAAVWRFLRAPSGGSWPDGRPLRFALLAEFAEHLLPRDHSGASDDELAAIEWVRLLSSSLALRQHGHAFLLHVPDEGHLDAHTRGGLRSVRLAHPDREAKRAFLEAGLSVYSRARLSDGLDVTQAAYLSANTPNWGLETLLRQSHSSGQPVTPGDLIIRRAQDVAAISEGMLTPLQGDPPVLYGLTVNHAWNLLRRIAEGLRQGDARTPHNVLLAGGPGFGKSVLALLLALLAGVVCFWINSPKAGIVGETERRAALLFQNLNEWAPSVGFIDEITEMFTTQRPEHDLDAGASRAVIGALLAYLGDENRRGRTLLLAATNCPWRISDALLSRFILIPVLAPLEEDYAGIVCALVRRVAGAQIPTEDPSVQAAAKIFFAKGASPRHIVSALSNTYLVRERLDPDGVLEAAQDFCGDTRRESAEYADLWAIKLTTSKSFFPWSGRRDYKLPAYLRGIVDVNSGEVDREALGRRIRELQPRVNV